MFTESQILTLKGTRIPLFAESMTDECDCSSRVRNSPDHRRSFNMPPIMDKRTGQGKYTLLELPKFGRIADI
jgi:hypothetical protein